MTERIPKPGEFYRHFKNKLYQIITVATHSETGEKLVVYQALYGDFGVYARPLPMFVSEVDHEKYPDVKQKYRFERVEMSGVNGYRGGNAGTTDQSVQLNRIGETGSEVSEMVGSRNGEPGLDPAIAAKPESDPEPELSPLLLPFVEADSIDQQLELLMAMTGKIGQRELDILYVALDLPQRGGSVEEQIHGIRQYLEMQKRFDGGRLR